MIVSWRRRDGRRSDRSRRRSVRSAERRRGARRQASAGARRPKFPAHGSWAT